MTGAILSINSGSSSIKFGLFETCDGKLRHAAGGKLEKIGISPRLEVRDRAGDVIATREWVGEAQLTHAALLEDLFGWAQEHLPHRPIAAVGHPAENECSRPVNCLFSSKNALRTAVEGERL